MPASIKHPFIAILGLAVPAGAVAVTLPTAAPLACAAAVVLWLAALGWGFHAMLHHRLAAEDRLAQLESAVALERESRHAAAHSARVRTAALDAAWRRLEDSLCGGDRGDVPARMHAVQAAIVLLHEPA